MAISHARYPLRVVTNPDVPITMFTSAPSPLCLNAAAPDRVQGTAGLESLISALVLNNNLGVPVDPIEIAVRTEGKTDFHPLDSFYAAGLPDGLHELTIKVITA